MRRRCALLTKPLPSRPPCRRTFSPLIGLGRSAMFWNLKRVGVLAALVVAVGAVDAIGADASFAAGTKTCSGGSIAAGSYSSLTITGSCKVDAGNVNVARNLTAANGGELIAAFGGSDLHVG